MKAVIVKRARVRSIAVAIVICAINNILAQARKGPALNEDAFAFAMHRIKEGHFVADSKGAWRGHRPSANEENEFIRLHGFGEYAKWHLGIDDHYPENTKQRYKFPFGDFKNVHRCGLLAAKARAGQYGYTEIENAAAELERAIKQSKSGAALPYSKTWPRSQPSIFGCVLECAGAPALSIEGANPARPLETHR
jgi:hypothetical protein